MRTQKLLFNKIIVIQSLGVSDRKTGNTIYNDTLRYAGYKLEGFGVDFVEPQTKAELEYVLNVIANDAEKRRQWPFLHFEMHGTQTGMEIANGEFITWLELYKFLVKINESSRHNLFVSLACCFGAYIFDIIDPTKRAPFYCFLGPSKEIKAWKLEENFTNFFSTLIETTDINCAIDALNGDSEEKYIWYDSEHVFDLIMNGWKNLSSSSVYKRQKLHQFAQVNKGTQNSRLRRQSAKEALNNQQKNALQMKRYFLFQSDIQFQH